MKKATISKIKTIVEENGATSGFIVLFNEPTAACSGASYGIDKEQCRITGDALDTIIDELEAGEITLW